MNRAVRERPLPPGPPPIRRPLDLRAALLMLALCIVWGFHISRRNRREGWWCVLLALIEVLVIILKLTKRF